LEAQTTEDTENRRAQRKNCGPVHRFKSLARESLDECEPQRTQRNAEKEIWFSKREVLRVPPKLTEAVPKAIVRLVVRGAPAALGTIREVSVLFPAVSV
jgi:hypothetical protein